MPPTQSFYEEVKYGRLSFWSRYICHVDHELSISRGLAQSSLGVRFQDFTNF